MKDNWGRKIEYIRLSVIDRCDLRCFYCLPKGFKAFQSPEEWLTLPQLHRLVGIFAKLGVSRVRITGGEPLLRSDLSELITGIAQFPKINDISLSTNAVRLASWAERLKQAGIGRMNISLDTLRNDRFEKITGGGKLDKVLTGIATAQAVGMSPIKINMVVMKDLNDDEIEAMVDFCQERQLTLRFIETMPVGASGQQASGHYLPLAEIEERLHQRYHLEELPHSSERGAGPARYWQVKESGTTIGFITPLSQHFCETCNRVRLTATGTLYLCLGHNDKVELRPLLSDDVEDSVLEKTILDAIARKPIQHEFCEKPEQELRYMAVTGG